MPYKHRRNCPLCCKPNLLYLANHLSQVHGLTSEERQPWLKSAMFSNNNSPALPSIPPFPFWSLPYQAMSMNQPQPTKPRMKNQPQTTRLCKKQTKVWLDTKAYPEFKFNHMFSMLVVGPSQSGKTYFVEELLTNHVSTTQTKSQEKFIGFIISGNLATQHYKKHLEMTFNLRRAYQNSAKI